MLADAQGARVAAYLLDGDGPGRRRVVVPRGRQRLGHADREGARPPRRAGGGVRRRAGRVAPGRPTRRSTSTWPASCGRAWTRSSSWAELDDDLGEAQVDYDDAPFGVQYWVMRWTSDRLSELSDADLDELYAVESRPWLRVNMVSTVDGAATGPDGRSGGINNAADKRVFDTLRRLCDAVVVGAGTARDEGYRPFTKPLVLVSRQRRGPAPAARRAGRLGADGDLRGGRAPRRDPRAPGRRPRAGPRPAPRRPRRAQAHAGRARPHEPAQRGRAAAAPRPARRGRRRRAGPHRGAPRCSAASTPGSRTARRVDLPLTLALLLEDGGTLLGRWLT